MCDLSILFGSEKHWRSHEDNASSQSQVGLNLKGLQPNLSTIIGFKFMHHVIIRNHFAPTPPTPHIIGYKQRPICLDVLYDASVNTIYYSMKRRKFPELHCFLPGISL